MPNHVRWAPVVLAALAIGCAAPTVQLQQRAVSAAPALSSLRSGSFDDAGRSAEQSLAGDPDNPYARLTRAIVRYKTTMHQLSLDVRTVVIGGIEGGALNHRYITTTFDQAERDLAAVEDDLAHAAARPGVAVELCIACWEIDWNGNGRIDNRDRLLMQIEVDADGKQIPEDDPRRKPTFRFDDGDIAWARAFVAFQRAALDVVLAYDLSGADGMLAHRRRDRPSKIVLKLSHPERIEAARRRILEGLDQSEKSRRLYLSETDDDREWVPNPRQQNHPLPMPVDAALYSTWEGVVGDLKRLVQGKEGLSVTELAQLGDHQWENPPRGFVDVGGMLAHPKDIVIDLDALEKLDRARNVEGELASVLGDYYRRDMKASPLPGRLSRMKGEVDRREETIERKLRYLFWIN
jgi:hypothetical protein